MKVTFVLFTIIGLSVAAPAVKDLQDDLQDFVGIIPMDKLRAIVTDHFANDDEFKAIVNYLKGDEWAALVTEIKAKPAVQVFKRFLIDAGIDVEKILEWINKWITGAETSNSNVSRGLKDFVEEIKAALPVDQIVLLFLYKLQNNEEFQEFYSKVSNEDAYQLVEEVRAIPEVQRLTARLLELGIDVKLAFDFIYSLFGWD